MITMHRGIAVLGIVLLLFSLAATPVAAQKTQKAEKPKPAQLVPQTVKDVLRKFEGKTTSLGILKSVAADYFSVDLEGAVSMYPLSAIHTFRVVKDEEAGTEILEIHLVAKE